MLELIKHGTTYDFMGKRRLVMSISLIITLIALYGIFFRMDYGVDFRGGAEIQTKFAKNVHLDEIRDSLEKGGFKGTSVQTIGEEKDNEVLIKVQADEGSLNLITQNISDSLHKSFEGNSVEIRKVDIVGPKAGTELRLSAVKAMFWAILSIMVYMAIRFDFRYAPGVMVSLTHDIVIVTGVLAFAGVEFSLHIVAALLAIIGYSVNDTVIVYDRIREHEEKDSSKTLETHINEAVNDTLSRTVLTSAATLLVAASMFFFGGAAIRDFFLAMSIGIIFGTYSSVYVAASTTLYFDSLSKKWNTKNANKKITA